MVHAGIEDGTDGVPGKWRLAGCAGCGAGYLDPRPTPAAIARAYPGTYYTHAEPQLEPDPVGTMDRARRALRNGYVNGRFGLNMQPASAWGALVRAVVPLSAQIDREFRHLVRPRPGARLLDVGCGRGDYVLKMRGAGWDATGQEVDPASAAVARSAGVTVTEDPLGGVADREAGTYDAITLNHVIEHVHDPLGLLRDARRLLAPGGRLWLATPNLNSAGHDRYGPSWLALDPPRHLVLFTARALRSALERAGFHGITRPRPWAMAGVVWARSELIRRGEPAPLIEHGARWPDLVSLVARGRAEELVVIARPA